MSIEQQVAVLNEITQIMHNSAHGRYEEMRCAFEYETYDGGWSVGSQYSFVRDGSSISELLDDPEDKTSGLIHKLHELMKAHTGGEWKSLVLTVDATGRAHTKFAYEE